MLISSAGDPALYSAPAKNPTAFTFTKLSVSPAIAVDSLRGVSYDLVDKKVYWVEKSISGKVRRANLDGSNAEDVATGVNSKNFKMHFCVACLSQKRHMGFTSPIVVCSCLS